MTHPLTHEIIEKIVVDIYENTDFNDCDEYEDVLFARAAADWQLEQVIEWLLCASLYDYLYLWDEGAEIKKDELIADLKKEMRPQEDSNDSP